MNNYIFIISGKAKSGKDTTASFIKEYANDLNLKTINLQFSSYIKMYAQSISSWDGLEEDKPRKLLQELGEKIRENIDENFFINRIIEDIKVYSHYFDVITISDTRLPQELDGIKKAFPQTIKIHLIRNNSNNIMNEEEKKHHTETALDNYQNFEYIINNDKTLEDLKENIKKVLKNNIN